MSHWKREITPPGLKQLARGQFNLTGDIHHLVTFLNRTLKTRGLIFGLSLAEDNSYVLTIYDEPSLDYRHSCPQKKGE